MKETETKIENILGNPKALETIAWTQSYKQNSSIKFECTLELTKQISHVTNFNSSDWSIPA